METAWFRRYPGLLRVLAVVAPLAVAALLELVVDMVTNSASALVLVLVVVGAAATGDRLAGVLAALSAAVGFDVFLTRPYFQLRIDAVEDAELAALLLLVGLAVSELASWGIRQSRSANEQAGFVQGALESALLASGSIDTADGLARASDGIRKVLGVEAVDFVYGEHDAGAAVLHQDGTVRRRGKDVAVAADGLPGGGHAYTAIPIAHNGAQVGYFRVTSPTRTVRPSREQLRVAALLASQWSLRPVPRHPTSAS
jgi:K+-sensing histidine kinase KdpD